MCFITVITGLLSSSCVKSDLFEFYDVTELQHNLPRIKNTKEGNFNPYSCFPTLDELAASSVVAAKMNTAWQMTLDACTQNGRREYGFYIYYSTNNVIYCGDIIEGPEITGTSAAYIELGPNANNQEVCGFFHTHTSLEFFPAGHSRSTGPSESDINRANYDHLPGLLYDYSSSVIKSGQPKTSNYELYSFGPNRRYL